MHCPLADNLIDKATLIDSTRQSSGLWNVQLSYFPLYSYYDSAMLDQQLLATWRAGSWNGVDTIGQYTLQLLKIEYDETIAAVRFSPGGRFAGTARDLSVLAGSGTRVYSVLGRAARLVVEPKAVAPRAAGYYILRAPDGEGVLQLQGVELPR